MTEDPIRIRLKIATGQNRHAFPAAFDERDIRVEARIAKAPGLERRRVDRMPYKAIELLELVTRQLS